MLTLYLTLTSLAFMILNSECLGSDLLMLTSLSETIKHLYVCRQYQQ